MTEAEWARQKAELIRRQGSASGGLDPKARRELGEKKRAATPKMWLDTRQSLRRRMDLINQSLGENVLQWAGLDNNKVVIRIQGEFDEILSVTYHPDILELRCEFPNRTEIYRPKVAASGEVLFRENQGTEKNPEDLAQHIFDQFVVSL
ncbi:MAG TPA: hypothetical protein VEJ39_03900 [Candidatus Acidoferrales bacterium]|nr:hypothetical protein [Candidatus Acidoferrales bacterium]